jgi:PPK2 family polyphosphate:nucleotide phosphotransferase
MKPDPADFIVKNDTKVGLKDWPTRVDAFYAAKDDYEELLDSDKQTLRKLQDRLYAHNRYALLIIFQAMDAAGKDGAIKNVMSGVNPQGCQVFSFKHPSAEELDHDFLWRATRNLPERGRIGIFNRSYYEEVLVVRVHRDILLSQALPEDRFDEKTVWEERFRSIVDLESHLHRNGTQIVKIFLHLSKEEQRQRFLSRIDDPDKNWKFSRHDVEERQLWGDYMKAYEACLSATSTKTSPWYIVPADDKKNARLIISRIIVETLKGLKLDYPQPDDARLAEIQALRKMLEEEGRE